VSEQPSTQNPDTGFQTTTPAPPNPVLASPPPDLPWPPATTPAPPTATTPPQTEAQLHRGQLVSYVVVDDAGNEHTATGVVVDVFDVTENTSSDTTVVPHAQVANLPAPLAIRTTLLSPLT
jgi:hypothetical protein